MNTDDILLTPFVLDFTNPEGFAKNGVIYSGAYDVNGNYEFVKTADGTDCMRLVYSPTDASMNDYRIMFGIKDLASFSDKKRYMRVTYMTTETSVASVTLCNNYQHQTAVLVKNTAPYAGKWHRSDVLDISDSSFMNRFMSGKYNCIQFSSAEKDSEFFIKELAFFESRADAYTYYGDEISEVVPFKDDDIRTIKIGSNDISKYRIVADKNLSDVAMYGLNKMVEQIKRLTGVTLQVVTDREPEIEYEIIVGKSDRALSMYGLEGYDHQSEGFRRYAVSYALNKLIITAANGFGVRSAIDRFLEVFLYKELVNVPEIINLGEACTFTGLSNLMSSKSPRNLPENVDKPQVFTESFDLDRGYFVEEANASDFKYQGGYLHADVKEKSRTYLHIYETNATVTASFMCERAGNNGDMGLVLRSVSEDGYLKAGYDFYKGEWYIDSREGNDFYCFRLARMKADLMPNKRYTVSFTADGRDASLSVDGERILSVSELSHIAAGRIGIIAEDTAVSVYDFKAVLLSGEGKMLKSIVHTILPMNCVGNGASFFELSDGTVHAHIPMYNVGFASNDCGETWDKTDIAIGEKGKYANILRLTDGTFIGVFAEEANGKKYIISRISEDEGKTWKDRAKICDGYYKETEALALNMNDKLTESPKAGRVFYAQNYQIRQGLTVNGRIVFCEFYYTDDKGATWHKSETDSWQIEGNESEKYFGECKILECDDGTLRMYCSWSDHGCIVYSESKDNGVTWGQLHRMEEFITPRSSMQFCRDPYGETDTTYYMVWINNEISENPTMPRSRLSLAKTTDGKKWVYLGDIWRWESAYLHHASKGDLNQIVNTTIGICRDRIIVGSGISEKLHPEKYSYHGFQQQHIWAIDRTAFKMSNYELEDIK